MANGKKVLITFFCLVFAFTAIFAVNAFANEESSEVTPGSKGEIQVWLIGGQSNAVGYGEYAPEAGELDSRYIEGFDNVLYYGIRHEVIMDDFMPTAVGMGKTPQTCGAELGIAGAFGNSDEKHAVIKYAVGGTGLYPIASQTWTPPSYIADVNSDDDPNNDVDTATNVNIGKLYSNFIETVRRGLELLIEDGYTPVIRGIYWDQGEADTVNHKRALEYEKLFRYLIQDMRRDVSEIANDPSLNSEDNPVPFVINKIFHNLNSDTDRHTIDVPIVNGVKEKMAQEMKNVTVVDASDTYKFFAPDIKHYVTETQVTLGEMFVSYVYSLENKYLVTYNGEHALVDIGFNEAGSTVTAHFTAAPKYKIASVTMQTGSGEPVPVTLTDNTYTFTMPSATVLFSVEVEPISASEIETEYGTIPKKYYLAEDYPIVVFKNGEFVGAATAFSSGVDVIVAEAGDGAVVLLRRDYDMSYDRAGANHLAALNGSAIYDLGGNTISMGLNSSSDAFLKCDAYGLGYVTDITVKNGTILVGEDPLVRFSGSLDRMNDSYRYGHKTNPQKYTVTFDKINIGLDTRVTNYGTLVAYAHADIEGADQKLVIANVVLNECDIDIRGTKDGYNIINQRMIDLNCDIIGGSIVADSLSSVTFNLSANVTMKKGADGNYLTVSATTPFKTDCVFSSESGDALKFVPEAGVSNSYVLEKLVVTTPYGEVPGKYVTEADYPWLVYKNGECLGGGKDFTNEVFDIAAAAGDGAVIYLRCDVDDTEFTSAADSQSNFNGTVTVDLGNHSVTMYTLCLIRCQVVGKGYNTNIILKNGSVSIGKDPLVRFAATSDLPASYAEDAKTDPHSFTVTLENLKIKRNTAAETSSGRLVCYSSTSYKDSADATITLNHDNNLVVKDCEMDVTSLAAGTKYQIFESIKALGINVTFIGGSLKANDLLNTTDGIRLTSLGGGSILVGKGSDGNYPKFILPKDAAMSNKTYTDFEDSSITDVKLFMTKRGAEENVYTFMSEKSIDLSTPYGSVTVAYASAAQYPFALFVPDTEKGGYKFIAAYTDWGYDNKTSYPLSALYTTYKSYQSGAVIYLRCDFNYDAAKGFSMMGKHADITIDLGGHTITDNSTHNYGLLYSSKKETTDTTVTLKNGTVVLKARPLISIYTSEAASTSTNLNFSLESVKIECAEGASLENVLVRDNTVSSCVTAINLNISLKNCTFDLTNAPENATLFNADLCFKIDSTVKFNTKITVEGGEIIAPNAFILSSIYRENNSSVTFVKAENGNYTSFTVSKTGFDSAQEVDGSSEKLVFVKVSETADTVTYKLGTKKEAYVEFLPKMSLTLDSRFIMNVYVPAIKTLQGFVFDDVTYAVTDFDNLETEMIDGAEYYVFRLPLASYEAARTVVLTATVLEGQTSSDATFFFSIPDYAIELSGSGNASMAEKSLVLDVLAYLKAAYLFFGTNDPAAIAKIDSFISNYDAIPTVEGTYSEQFSGLSYATFVLDEAPRLRFYFANGMSAERVAFYINGNEVDTEICDGGACVDINVSAYMLAETVTYTVDGVEAGSYHIRSYYDFVINEYDGADQEALLSVVRTFWKYLQSAKAYKNQQS